MSIINRIASIKAKLEQLRNINIVVGITETVANQTYKDGTKLGDVAKWMEYGVPGKIPPRPFMKQSAPKLSAMYNEALDQVLKKIMRGENVDLNEWADRVGMAAVNIVRDTIEDADSWAEPNKPAVEKRKERKWGESHILQDTGDLLRSITYDVR